MSMKITPIPKIFFFAIGLTCPFVAHMIGFVGWANYYCNVASAESGHSFLFTIATFGCLGLLHLVALRLAKALNIRTINITRNAIIWWLSTSLLVNFAIPKSHYNCDIHSLTPRLVKGALSAQAKTCITRQRLGETTNFSDVDFTGYYRDVDRDKLESSPLADSCFAGKAISSSRFGVTWFSIEHDPETNESRKMCGDSSVMGCSSDNDWVK